MKEESSSGKAVPTGTLRTSDAVNHPNYYVMPDGAEVVHITKWLNSSGGQAVQYIVRSTRIDGVVKENPIEDIDKAIFWLNVERERLAEAEKVKRRGFGD